MSKCLEYCPADQFGAGVTFDVEKCWQCPERPELPDEPDGVFPQSDIDLGLVSAGIGFHLDGSVRRGVRLSTRFGEQDVRSDME